MSGTMCRKRLKVCRTLVLQPFGGCTSSEQVTTQSSTPSTIPHGTAYTSCGCTPSSGLCALSSQGMASRLPTGSCRRFRSGTPRCARRTTCFCGAPPYRSARGGCTRGSTRSGTSGSRHAEGRGPPWLAARRGRPRGRASRPAGSTKTEALPPPCRGGAPGEAPTCGRSPRPGSAQRPRPARRKRPPGPPSIPSARRRGPFAVPCGPGCPGSPRTTARAGWHRVRQRPEAPVGRAARGRASRGVRRRRHSPRGVARRSNRAAPCSTGVPRRATGSAARPPRRSRTGAGPRCRPPTAAESRAIPA
mmetsp:Transcript_75836/g.214427  ORF Transcript_75836/g.214427 Transcript_75836/m.214427 type:complete len:304 (+) Transcript_75836:34-945(+)